MFSKTKDNKKKIVSIDAYCICVHVYKFISPVGILFLQVAEKANEQNKTEATQKKKATG